MTIVEQQCRWCGNIHERLCPYVKAFEFAEDGTTVRRVEFMTPADYQREPNPPAPKPTYPRLGQRDHAEKD